MTTDDILLVIAAYLRRQNHPTETDEQIAAGVRTDIGKVMHARAEHQRRVGAITEDEHEARREHAALYT